MLNKFMPSKFWEVIKTKVNICCLNEIRLRVDKPIVLIISGKPFFLCSEGLSTNIDNAFFSSKSDIEDIIFRASECSVYSVNEQLKQGFLMCENGVRLGICGTLVIENNIIKTIKNFTSINIRIPHQIKNVSLIAYKDIVSKTSFMNTLIIAPPGAGKTTFLRDIIFQMSERGICSNVLVIDERGEIAGNFNNGGGMNVGNFADVISFSDKPYAIIQGIRVMNPNIIITDELATSEDVQAIKLAINSGVKVLCSVHGDSLEVIKRKEIFSSLFKEKYFDRFVVLSNRNGPGTFEGLYDSSFSRLIY